MKVLIAEDDPISRTVLRKTLEWWGHDVFAAPDGAQAWAAFQQETFPVVIYRGDDHHAGSPSGHGRSC